MKKFVYLLPAFIIGFTGSCTDQKQEEEILTQIDKFCLNQQLKKSTVIEEIHEQPIHEQLTLSGKIEYNKNDLVAYNSLLQGSVVKVNFELGDYVKKGQVLALINSTEIQNLTQEKRSYQTQIALNQKLLKSKKELLADGFTTQAEVLEIEHDIQSAKIELDKINATLNMYQANGNGQFKIIAPKNGYIVQKSISEGQSITNDMEEALFSISNLKQVWVMVNIYASNLKYIHQGDVVQVKTIAFPDRIYQGKIDKIYNVFDDNEHVLKARVVLENTDLNLLPGLSADIIIDKQNKLGNAFAIPNHAIVFDNNKEFVVIYKNDCEMEIRKITPFAKNETYTYVKDGFKPAEKIISKNGLIIYEELNK